MNKNFNIEKLIVGQRELFRRELILLQMGKEQNEKRLAFLQEELERGAEALNYYQKYVQYEEALDYASK